MKLSDIPAKFNIPFANSAGGGFIRAIPEASQIGITPGAASLTDGFVPLNFQPVGAGGVPPFGQDFNGLLKQVTQWNRWNGAGGIVPFDAAFATQIGGYPRGTIVTGDLPGVVWLNLVDDNTGDPDLGAPNWRQFALTIPPSSTTFWVRTDGSNSNDGSANTAQSAFATIAGALAYIKSAFGTPGREVTIRLGVAGTYDMPQIIGFANGVNVLGDVTSPTSYVLSGADPAGFFVQASLVHTDGVTLTAQATTQTTVQVSSGAVVYLGQAVRFAGAGVVGLIHCLAATGGTVIIDKSVTFASSAAYAIRAAVGGQILASFGATVTFLGTPVYSTATVSALTGGVIDIGTVTFSGAVTGKRYDASLNGVINTNGGGTNFIPGSVAGTTATGGQYA